MKLNYDFLNEMGFAFKGYANVDNIRINEFFDTSSQESIFVELSQKNKGTNTYETKMYEVSRNDYELSFTNDIWSKLDLKQKLRILTWAKEDILTSFGCGQLAKKPINFITSRDYLGKGYEYPAYAIAGKLYLNLDYLSKLGGYDNIINIYHECVHIADYIDTRVLIEKYSGKFLPGKYASNLSEEIMKLPITGMIQPKDGSEKCYVTDNLQKDFMMIKNFTSTSNFTNESPRRKKDVCSQKSFINYLRRLIYFTCPIERRAYIESTVYTLKLMDKNSKIIKRNIQDNLTYKDNIYILQFIGATKRQVQKYFKMPAMEVVNMEIIHRYNEEVFGDNKDKYICKDIEAKREKAYKDVWDRKFSANLKMNQYDEKLT